MDFSKNQSFLSHSEQETEQLGEAFAKTLFPGAIVAMRGGMGAGKTAMTRGMARGLGFSGRVTSPTYAIVNEYEGALPLFHFDLFRLGSADELYDIGFEDYLTRGGVLVIEWFQNAEDAVNADFEVSIAPCTEDDNVRQITIKRRH